MSNPHFGATFAQRKAIAAGEPVEPVEPVVVENSTFASRKARKARKAAEDKAVKSSARKGRRR